MSSELNSVQESIKLALDAADAATDVTSEYSQVKREHKKLESKVSQIHKYTTITFVTAMAAAVAGIGFSAVLYFKTLGELRLMTKTNREGLVVFAENIDDLNTILADLNVALELQAELVALNKESSDKVTKMMKLIEQSRQLRWPPKCRPLLKRWQPQTRLCLKACQQKSSQKQWARIISWRLNWPVWKLHWANPLRMLKASLSKILKLAHCLLLRKTHPRRLNCWRDKM